MAALFLGELGFYFAYQVIKSKDGTWIALIVSSFIVMGIIWKIKEQYGKEILNLNLLAYYVLITIGRFFANFAMLCSGYLFAKRYKQKLKERYNWIIGIVCLGIMIMLVKIFPNSINLHVFEINSPLLFIATSYLGTLGIYFISCGIKKNLILDKLGKYSLGIMILHYYPFATMKYADTMAAIITDNQYAGVFLATIFSLVICVIGIFFCSKKLFVC